MRVDFSDRAEALLERLCAALESFRDNRQPGGAPPASVTRSPRAVPAADAGAAAGEVIPTQTPPPVLEIHPVSGRRARADRGKRRPTRATWRTKDREDALILGWPTMSASALVAVLAAMPGPPLPEAAVKAVSNWRTQLRLPTKPVDPAKGGRPPNLKATWADALAWADAHDPDMVLRGSPAQRLEQINELRRLNGERPFVLAEREAT